MPNVFRKTKKKAYTFMFPPGLIADVDKIKDLESVSRSEAMRQLLALGIAYYGKLK